MLLDAAQYKCPNCNAELKFDPISQNLSCEYCMSSFTIDEIKEIYPDSETAIEEETVDDSDFSEHTNLYHCSSCGADIMADDRQTALFCYYCHNPVILSGKLTGEYRPSKVIGFKITRDEALGKMKEWCRKRMFLPNDFNTEEQLEKTTGLYVPFWIADCNTRAQFSGIGKKVRSWTSGKYRYTETKEYSVIRDADIITKGIPADGESKIDDLLMEAIEPFDYAHLKDFDMSYLSGFYADKYDVDKAGVFPRIRERVTTAGKKVINDSITGYTSVSRNTENYNIRSTKWQYIMLPVWFMTYRYQDKVYEFAINGQTGKLAGTPPLNKSKLRLFSAGIGLAAAVVCFLIGGMIF